MMQLHSVSKKFGKHKIFENVDQIFEQGVTLLVGPSGAGKTTLLRLCATADKPSSGHLSWDGKPIKKNIKRVRSVLGYAPQLVDLPDDLTAMEFLGHMAALKGLGAGTKNQSYDLLEQLSLAESADKRIGLYSGGMRRRLILAQALLGSPRLLALDEPTAELDSETAKQVALLISAAAKTAIVLVTTHLTDHFESLGANLLQVKDGGVSIQ